jgi:hypothetical protein
MDFYGVPFYVDNVSAINATFADAGNANVSTLQINPSSLVLSDINTNLMQLDIHSINFSDSSGTCMLDTTSLSLNTTQSNLKLSGVNSSYDLTIAPGSSLNLNVSKLLLSGIPAPATGGQNLVAQGQNGLQWFSITDLLNLEAGLYRNFSSTTSANITFNRPYLSPPSVVVTPDADGSGNIIPVALNGVSTTNFSVIFASNKLNKFNFVVLPINSIYSINAPDTTPLDVSDVSSLNASVIPSIGNI